MASASCSAHPAPGHPLALAALHAALPPTKDRGVALMPGRRRSSMRKQKLAQALAAGSVPDARSATPLGPVLLGHHRAFEIGASLPAAARAFQRLWRMRIAFVPEDSSPRRTRRGEAADLWLEGMTRARRAGQSSKHWSASTPHDDRDDLSPAGKYLNGRTIRQAVGRPCRLARRASRRHSRPRRRCPYAGLNPFALSLTGVVFW